MEQIVEVANRAQVGCRPTNPIPGPANPALPPILDLPNPILTPNVLNELRDHLELGTSSPSPDIEVLVSINEPSVGVSSLNYDTSISYEYESFINDDSEDITGSELPSGCVLCLFRRCEELLNGE